MGIALKYKWLKKINWRILLADIISGALLVLFLYTALSKLRDYHSFKSVLQETPIIKPIARTVALGLPSLEIVLAVLLFFPATRRKGLYISLTLLTLFTIYLIYMVSTVSHLPCNCGGVLNSLTWKEHICFNIFCIIVSLIGIAVYGKYAEQPNKSPP